MAVAQGHVTIRRQRKGDKGDDAVMYEIAASVGFVSSAADGTVQTGDIEVSAYKTAGESRTAVKLLAVRPSDEVRHKVQYRIDGGGWADCGEITVWIGDSAVLSYGIGKSAVAAVRKRIELRLLDIDGNVLRDGTVLDVVRDGAAGNGIVSANVYFGVADSDTAEPEDSVFAADSVKELTLGDGKWLWQATVTRYTDGRVEYSGKMCLGSCDSFASVTEQYSLGDASAADGDWATAVTPVEGKWLWERTRLIYNTTDTADAYKYVPSAAGQRIGYYGENGDDAVVFDIEADTESIEADSSGAVQTGSITVTAYKTTGSRREAIDFDMVSAVTGETYKGQYSIDDGEWSGLDRMRVSASRFAYGITAANVRKTMRRIGLRLLDKDGNVVKGGVTIGVVRNGADGAQGCVMRSSEWAEGVAYLNDERDTEKMSSGETRIVDVAMTRDESLKSGWRAYKCIKSHTSSAEITTEDAEYWQEMNSMAPIYTPMILADNAKIRFGATNQIVVVNSESKVQGAFSGTEDESGGYILWIGGERAEASSFNVSYGGVLTAVRAVLRDADVSGKVTATSGSIGGFEIADGRIGASATASGGGGGLSIQDGFMRVGDKDNYLFMGANVDMEATGYVTAMRVTVTDTTDEKDVNGLIVNVAGGRKRYGLVTNGSVVARSCISNRAGVWRRTEKPDFSQYGVFKLTGGTYDNLPTKGDINGMFKEVIGEDFVEVVELWNSSSMDSEVSGVTIPAYGWARMMVRMSGGDVVYKVVLIN